MDEVMRQEAWYQDPTTGNDIQVFGSAANFAGIAYPPYWRLESRFADPEVGLLPSAGG